MLHYDGDCRSQTTTCGAHKWLISSNQNLCQVGDNNNVPLGYLHPSLLPIKTLQKVLKKDRAVLVHFVFSLLFVRVILSTLPMNIFPGEIKDIQQERMAISSRSHVYALCTFATPAIHEHYNMIEQPIKYPIY